MLVDVCLHEQGEGVITRGAEGVGTATVVWDSGVVQSFLHEQGEAVILWNFGSVCTCHSSSCTSPPRVGHTQTRNQKVFGRETLLGRFRTG